MGTYDTSRIALDSSGTSLSYHEEGGRGSPSLLLLHGLNGHSGTWRKNIPFLSGERRVIAPTLPSWHGSPQSLDIGRYVKFTERFLTKLELEKVAIAGNSMGGWIAMRVAGDRPEQVGALILEDSAGVSSPGEEDLFRKIDASGFPVLIIWGKEDKILPLDAGRYLHSKIHASSLVVLDGVGHVPHWERPELYNSVVMDFLRKAREKQSKSDK